MREKKCFVADDGMEFNDKDQCIAYEYSKHSELVNKYHDLSFEEQYNIIKTEFNRYSNKYAYSDATLIEEGSSIRSGGIVGNIACEFDRGIVYLRDDAVEVLLNYIEYLKGIKE